MGGIDNEITCHFFLKWKKRKYVSVEGKSRAMLHDVCLLSDMTREEKSYTLLCNISLACGF